MKGARIPAWLALGLPASGLLFNLAWLVLGFVSPGFTIWGTVIAPYSPVSAGISGLGLGETAPLMNSAFVVSGLLALAGAVGTMWNIPRLSAGQRWISFVLLGLLSAGLVTDGVFTLESIMFHLAGFLLGVAGMAPAFLVLGLLIRRIPGWQGLGNGLIAAAAITLALLVLYFATFSPTADGAKYGVSGLVERVLVLEIFLPVAVLGWVTFRRAGAD